MLKYRFVFLAVLHSHCKIWQHFSNIPIWLFSIRVSILSILNNPCQIRFSDPRFKASDFKCTQFLSLQVLTINMHITFLHKNFLSKFILLLVTSLLKMLWIKFVLFSICLSSPAWIWILPHGARYTYSSFLSEERGNPSITSFSSSCKYVRGDSLFLIFKNKRAEQNMSDIFFLIFSACI